MRIEFFYSRQTGVIPQAQAALNEAIDATGVQVDVVYTEVKDSEDAMARRCLGSPTIRVEGIDVEFDKAQELSGERVYAFIKKLFLRNGGADAGRVVELTGDGDRRHARETRGLGGLFGGAPGGEDRGAPLAE